VQVTNIIKIKLEYSLFCLFQSGKSIVLLQIVFSREL